MVLSTVLSPLGGLDRAIVYGSWAARYRGHVGPVPNDVDVLVIGDVDEDDLYDAVREAERQLGRPVNARRVRPAHLEPAQADPFLAGVIAGPTVDVELTGRTHEMATGAGHDRTGSSCRSELERVTPKRDHTDHLLSQARAHLASALAISDQDPAGAVPTPLRRCPQDAVRSPGEPGPARHVAWWPHRDL
jgi:hypothetical protein